MFIFGYWPQNYKNVYSFSIPPLLSSFYTNSIHHNKAIQDTMIIASDIENQWKWVTLESKVYGFGCALHSTATKFGRFCYICPSWIIDPQPNNCTGSCWPVCYCWLRLSSLDRVELGNWSRMSFEPWLLSHPDDKSVDVNNITWYHIIQNDSLSNSN